MLDQIKRKVKILTQSFAFLKKNKNTNAISYLSNYQISILESTSKLSTF